MRCICFLIVTFFYASAMETQDNYVNSMINISMDAVMDASVQS